MTDTPKFILPKPSELQDAAEARRTHIWSCPDNIPYDKLLEPLTWSNIGHSRFGDGDKLCVMAADKTWYAELIVRDASQSGVVMGELFHVRFDKPASVLASANLRAEHRGSALDWCVVNVDTKKNEVEGLKTKAAAEAWIKANQTT